MAQPHKGDRELVSSRLPRPLADLVREAAQARDISISAYIAEVLADRHGLTDLVPLTKPTDKGTLPLTG